jgi:hypothetical protein
MRQLAVIAALVFGVTALIAAAVPFPLLRQFAVEASLSPWRLAAVPGMFAMLYAMLLYQDAQRRIHSIAQSLSRGLLVTLLTWISFSAMMMWAWCAPGNYSACFGNVLLTSGMIGGGPLLIAGLLSAAIMGWLIINPPPIKHIEE